MSNSLLVPFLSLAVILAAGCERSAPGAGQSITLTCPHVLPAEHPVSKAIVRFAQEVHTRSGGRITVKVFEGGTLGNEQELADNVASGTNDFTKISIVILETKTELAKVFSLPYLFRDSDHMWKVLDGEIGQELLDMATAKGLKGICYFDAGTRSFYTKSRNLESPADLEGLKIRVQKSKSMERLVATLGGLPQQIAWGELFTALDTGVVDGAENNIPSYYTSSHYKVAPFFTFDEHVAVPDILVMSLESWERLGPDDRKLIRAAAEVAKNFQRQLWAESRATQIAKMEGEGVTFSRPDKAPFIERTRATYDQFRDTKVMEYVERIRAVE